MIKNFLTKKLDCIILNEGGYLGNKKYLILDTFPTISKVMK